MNAALRRRLDVLLVLVSALLAAVLAVGVTLAGTDYGALFLVAFAVVSYLLVNLSSVDLRLSAGDRTDGDA